MAEKFEHFYLEQKSESTVMVHCLSDTITEEVEEEANSIFSVLLRGTDFNVHIPLDRPQYLNQDFVMMLVGLAQHLKEAGRNITFSGVPESLARYLERFNLNSYIKIK